MKKPLLVISITILSFLVGIILFAFSDWILEYLNFQLNENLFYDLFLGPIIGLILSVLSVFFIKKHWKLSNYVWLTWFLGVIISITLIYLLISLVPISR